MSANELVLKQLVLTERRGRIERRRLSFWSVLYGGFRPRRRHARRTFEAAPAILDWHDPHLLAVTFSILLLCAADAAITVVLILGGAHELNPFMAKLLSIDVALFAGAKIALTGLGIGVLVLLSRFRLFGGIRVVQSLYAVLVIYLLLVAYELLILSSFF
jgi:hypothetical protein